jgi:hypothetical protein
MVNCTTQLTTLDLNAGFLRFTVYLCLLWKHEPSVNDHLGHNVAHVMLKRNFFHLVFFP